VRSISNQRKWLPLAAIFAVCVAPTFISYRPYVFRWDDSGYLQRSIALSRAFWSLDVHGMDAAYTPKQGQYLAFIYYYARIHGRAPAEAEMQQYFRVSPPAVHQMILTLEARGFIERIPGQARSIRLLIPAEELPDLI